jgi:hypothetical protein
VSNEQAVFAVFCERANAPPVALTLNRDYNLLNGLGPGKVNCGGIMPNLRGSFSSRAALFLLAATLASTAVVRAGSRNKADDNDITLKLFQLLDTQHNGKLDDIYVLADVYTDSSGAESRHVLRVDYDKSRSFGRLAIYLRSVGKMTPEQLAVYTPEQIYGFGEIDLEKFLKTEPGPFGQKGDLYLQSSDEQALHTTAVTDEARKRYETYVSQYIIPALQKGQ